MSNKKYIQKLVSALHSICEEMSLSHHRQISKKSFNKIGHSSWSSSIQRSKTTADQRCLVMFHIFGKFRFPSIEKRWTKDRQTKRKTDKVKIRKKEKKKKRKKEKK